MRRLPMTGVILTAVGVIALVLGLLGPVAAASAQAADPSAQATDSSGLGESAPTIANDGPVGFVAVVEAGGLLDPVLIDFMQQSITDAQNEGATALVFQMDSSGVVVDDGQLAALLTRIKESSVPIAIWIGPSGSSLTSSAAQVVAAASQVGMAPGTRLGNAGQPLIAGLDLARLTPIIDHTVGTQEAADLGITTAAAPTIGDFVVNLPGVQTKEVPADNGETRREPVTQVRFGQLSLFSQLMHTVASPAVA